jgi:enoyl-CoA hydratase/carnithine racemase
MDQYIDVMFRLNWYDHRAMFFQGVGLSVHDQYRVAMEKTVLAMPETSIGHFSGASHYFVLHVNIWRHLILTQKDTL